MLIEIDDGVIVNLDKVFCISYKKYNNRGAWVFQGDSRDVLSRQFNSAEEARAWLKNIFYSFKGFSVYLEGSAIKEDIRKRKSAPVEGLNFS